MESILKRLMACGVPRERAMRIIENYGAYGRWDELEAYVIVLEMHRKGET